MVASSSCDAIAHMYERASVSPRACLRNPLSCATRYSGICALSRGNIGDSLWLCTPWHIERSCAARRPRSSAQVGAGTEISPDTASSAASGSREISNIFMRVLVRLCGLNILITSPVRQNTNHPSRYDVLLALAFLPLSS